MPDPEAPTSSTLRTMPGGRAARKDLPKGENGRLLCRWCSLEVPKGRLTFCSSYCVHEWKLRTDPGYLREHVFARDRGMCALCGIDAHAAWVHIRRQRGTARVKAMAEWQLNGRHRRSLWDADHIIPVAEGGGECDLRNLRTLCLRCHRQVTAELRERLKARAVPKAAELRSTQLASAQSAAEPQPVRPLASAP